jgi:hypothetical protein
VLHYKYLISIYSYILLYVSVTVELHMVFMYFITYCSLVICFIFIIRVSVILELNVKVIWVVALKCIYLCVKGETPSHVRVISYPSVSYLQVNVIKELYSKFKSCIPSI